MVTIGAVCTVGEGGFWWTGLGPFISSNAGFSAALFVELFGFLLNENDDKFEL